MGKIRRGIEKIHGRQRQKQDGIPGHPFSRQQADHQKSGPQRQHAQDRIDQPGSMNQNTDGQQQRIPRREDREYPVTVCDDIKRVEEKLQGSSGIAETLLREGMCLIEIGKLIGRVGEILKTSCWIINTASR